MENTTHSIAAMLSQLADRKRLSEFAIATSIDRRTLQRIASGATLPHPSTVRLILIELKKKKWGDLK